jgi:hypothetical protein
VDRTTHCSCPARLNGSLTRRIRQDVPPRRPGRDSVRYAASRPAITFPSEQGRNGIDRPATFRNAGSTIDVPGHSEIVTDCLTDRYGAAMIRPPVFLRHVLVQFRGWNSSTVALMQ